MNGSWEENSKHGNVANGEEKSGEWKSQKYGSAVKSGDDRQRYGMENLEYWQRWKPNFMSLNKCNKLKVNSGGRRNIWKYGNTGKTGFTGIERE